MPFPKTFVEKQLLTKLGGEHPQIFLEFAPFGEDEPEKNIFFQMGW